MAKYYKYIFLLTSYIFLFTSCQEGGEAGDLFGQWRMADSDSKYVSFSGSITRFRDTNANEVYGNFQHKGDSLFIQCYSIEGTRSDTITIEESFGFKPFNNIRVKIETISSDVLILSKDGRKWNFSKY